jgi:hypothetical protein
MALISQIEPDQITAGDYIQWNRTLSDYPAGTWTLSYVLINASNKISFTAAASGTDHLVTLAAATSANYSAGEYSWQAYVTSGAQRITIGSGTITIKPNFATAATLDNRSHVKKVLDAVEALIEGNASKEHNEMRIGNRMLKLVPKEELLVMRDRYKAMYLAELRAEDIAKGLGTKNKIQVRF